MIRITVLDNELLPLNAIVYIASEIKKEIVINTHCTEGVIYLPEEIIDGGDYVVRVRYCTTLYRFKPIEFQVTRDIDYDLQFCVRMELD